ncbi:hypothetical protein [Streptomyces sp. NPDC051452]|uniref:hypothetical protein n=1 Tax=Streptomyces sp. NPDC051452 TaxID=3365654 RepID=UPI0037B3756D
MTRERVVPLPEALVGPLGCAEQTDHRYLLVPKNISDDDAETRVDLPRDLKFSTDQVADLITHWGIGAGFSVATSRS